MESRVTQRTTGHHQKERAEIHTGDQRQDDQNELDFRRIEEAEVHVVRRDAANLRQRRQNAGVNTTSKVKISRRPSSIAKLHSQVWKSLRRR